MIRDVFYLGQRPNVHPREQLAASLDDARSKTTTEHFWIINEFCNYKNFDWDFDFEFLADEDVWAKDHNNVWPSLHQKDSGTWLCPKQPTDLTLYRGDVDPIPRKQEKSQCWVEYDLIDSSLFDFSWHPDPHSPPYIYVWGNKWIDGKISPTIEHRTPGATEYKFMSNDVVMLPHRDCWRIPVWVDTSEFDFTWRPGPLEPKNFIFEFGTQWQKTDGPTYIPTGLDRSYPVHYIDNKLLKAKRFPRHEERFKVLNGFTVKDLDCSWHPDGTEEPYIYWFGSKWRTPEECPIIEFYVDGANSVKHIHNMVISIEPDMSRWEIPEGIDVSTFDFSWIPSIYSQPYIYQFGTQWQKTGGPRYIVPDATEVKYIDDQIAKALPKLDNWKVLHEVSNFDFSWHPDDTSPPYIYVFGNQWHKAEIMPTLEYYAPTATERKYVNDVSVRLATNWENWVIPDGVNLDDFDFDWVPDPYSPPYIYQFWTLMDPENGPRYITPNNNGEIVRLEYVKNNDYKQYYIKTTLEDLIQEHPDEIFWALSQDIDYSTFDFTWRPELEQAHYVHVFGETQTYFVNSKLWKKGRTDFNFVDRQMKNINLDVFFVDKGNAESAARFDQLQSKFGTKIQKTRYLNSWVDTINRCTNRATSNLIWVLNSELDYSKFDFNYYPNIWQMNMVHVFGTQWSHWGTTFLVNRETFKEDTKWIKIIEHLPNLNFVKTKRALATQCIYDIVVIDHGNPELETVLPILKSKASDKTVSVVKYNESYLKTFRSLIKTQQDRKEHYLWVCSSICDYSTFDFTYIPDPFTKDQLHVFPSNKQKFGDTFLLDVNKTKELIDEIESLEEYTKVNFNSHLSADRLPEPIIITNDTHIGFVDKIDNFPYATLITKDQADKVWPKISEPISLWDNKNILISSTGGSKITVPKNAKAIVKKELYDYPYIIKSTKLELSDPMDIVFLSNGEINAEENWEHLLSVTKGLKNRVTRVNDINGRVAAYHAVAEASHTPWVFTVFGKLRVNPKFDFNFQADRLQIPKHYIFHAKNPVNGLTYGHQAMILYQKKLVLSNLGIGLDFTLDDEHETVPVLSGIANYNTDEFSTWRAAFREVLKLKANTDDISKERLHIWLTKAEGDFSEFSLLGAENAIDYYQEVNGDFNALRLSYDWPWLKNKFDNG